MQVGWPRLICRVGQLGAAGEFAVQGFLGEIGNGDPLEAALEGLTDGQDIFRNRLLSFVKLPEADNLAIGDVDQPK